MVAIITIPTMSNEQSSAEQLSCQGNTVKTEKGKATLSKLVFWLRMENLFRYSRFNDTLAR